MPPPSPSPHYSPRSGISQQVSPLIGRSPFSRIPYVQSPRPQIGSPDPYGSAPMTPQSDVYNHPPLTPRPDTDTFPNNTEPFQYVPNTSASDSAMDNISSLTSPRSGGPQGQETRQHLRDLLQRQQIKKIEQDIISPATADPVSQSSPRPMSWGQGL